MRSSRLAPVLVCLVAGFLPQGALFAAPTITSFLTSRPAQARVGEPVIIAASGLAAPVKVFFSDGADPNVEATSITVDFDRGLIIARVPAGAVSGNIMIKANGVDSPLYYFTVEAGSFTTGTNVVSGTVTKNGSGLADVSLVLLRGAQCGNVVFQDFVLTDPNGAYTLQGLDGPYQIFIFPPRGAGVANSSTPVLLSSSPATQDIALAAGTDVTGKVLDSSLAPLANVRISTDSSSGPPSHDEMLTDPNGVFAANLLPGSHEYTIEPPSGIPQRTAKGTFVIDPNSPQALGVTTLLSGVSITGTLTRATGGTPLASAGVIVYDPNSCCSGADTKTTAGDGSFTLVVDPNATYDIRTEMESRTTVSDVIDTGVSVGATDLVHNLVAQEAAIISGKITLKGAGTPLECVGVQAVGAAPNFNFGFARSGVDGTYRLRLAADPNGYFVNTSETDGGLAEYATKTWDGTPNGTYFQCEGTPVAAPTAGLTTTGIDFSLEPGAAIEGIVTAASDNCVGDLGQSFIVFVDDGLVHNCKMGSPDFNFPGPGYRVHLLPPATNLRACVYPPTGYDAQCYDTKLPPDFDGITTTAGNTTPDINFCLASCTELTWYADNDQDSFGDPGNTIQACVQPTGFVANMTDCDDADPGVNPGATELCDAIDNNCDTQIDENLGNTSCGLGACQATVDNCVGGMTQTCEPGTPSAETCNAIDDDCNGVVDDLLGSLSCGVGACFRTVPSCDAGVPQICTPGAPVTETCNGVDDDCNAIVDDGLGNTTCGVGACEVITDNCVAGVPQICTPGAPAGETCNAIDDDCNGIVDDGLGDITCGLGACQVTVLACVAGAPQTCTPGAPSTETCNSIDDDCDGIIDNQLGTTTCGIGACQRTVQNCEAGLPQTCTPGSPALDDSTCNGIDDDCDGQVDEEFVSTPTTCGVGACAAAGQTTCVNGTPGDNCVQGTATAETCNNIDDNCDGTVDNFATSCGVGSCASTGSCVAGVDSCAAGQPGTETCDGLDNDCDGQVDNGITPQPTTCGVGACAANTGQLECLNGAPVDTCNPLAGALPDNNCDGVDNDCDGQTDESYVSTPTACGVGACTAAGATTCVNGSVGDSCVAGTPAANDSVCNGIDDDCDAQIDEEYVATPTTCGVGACSSNAGLLECQNGAPVNTCNPLAGALPDNNCDGVDNDCDGQTDESYVPTATACGVGACTAAGATTCVNGSVGDTCVAGTPAPNDSVCNGVDDDCDAQTDEDYAPTPTSCGVGACSAAGQTTCVNGVTGNTCTPGAPTTETCNGIDEDCDGQVDDGLGSTSCGVGGCRRTIQNCVGGVTQSCTPGSPTAESCDNVDNNCDGQTDEGLGSLSCGTGACQVTTPSCVAGVPQSCTPGAPTTETCDNIDNDCNGQTDEGLGSTSCGTGGCQRTVQNCVAGVPQVCTPGASTVETCDNIDNNCNGQTDEGLGSTTCGVGACQVTTQNCAGGATQICTPGTPSTETCDGVDNNCDGTKDEGNPGGGSACNTGQAGICLAGTTSCQSGGLTCVPNLSPGTETCNGLDDDCDGSVDNVNGGCSLFITDPLAGEVLDCSLGAVAPTLTWNPAQYDRYKVYLSADPGFATKQSINSGDTLLKVPTWTVPAKKWKSICGRVTTSLYLSVYGVDNDVPKSNPSRKATSPSVTVTVQK